MRQKKKILILENSSESEYLLLSFLNTEYDLVFTAVEEEGFFLLKSQVFDAILISTNIKGLDSFNVCLRIKNNPDTSFLPVIILASCSDPEKQFQSFSMGADDYICKPVSTLELHGRLIAKLRNQQRSLLQEDSCIQKGMLKINESSRRVFIKGLESDIEVKCTRLEFDLLILLSSRGDMVLTRDQILNHLWKDSLHVSDRTVDTHVSKLRKKLGNICGKYIESVHGTGYRFLVKDESEIYQKRAA